jgi:hypothetical protein
VTSRIPTLVLAGEYDIGVPPYIVRQVVKGLSRSHYYEFPGSAHLQLASFANASDCARSITAVPRQADGDTWLVLHRGHAAGRLHAALTDKIDEKLAESCATLRPSARRSRCAHAAPSDC